MIGLVLVLVADLSRPYNYSKISFICRWLIQWLSQKIGFFAISRPNSSFATWTLCWNKYPSPFLIILPWRSFVNAEKIARCPLYFITNNITSDLWLSIHPYKILLLSSPAGHVFMFQATRMSTLPRYWCAINHGIYASSQHMDSWNFKIEYFYLLYPSCWEACQVVMDNA